MFYEIIKLDLSIKAAGQAAANKRNFSKLPATVKYKTNSFKPLKVEETRRDHIGIAGKLS